MNAEVIEREVLIEAPVEVVWDVISDPIHLAGWWAEEAELDARPGGEGRLTFPNRTTPLRVEAAEPCERLVFRWSYPEDAEPTAGNSARVEFTLRREGDATRLCVAESGIETQTGDYRADHERGWAKVMELVSAYAVEQVAAAR